MEVFRTAVALMVRSMVLSAQSAGQQRLLWLQQSAAVGGEVGEVARLRDENRLLKWENRLLKARDADAPCRKRYSPPQRLQILWHMEYYRIPRSRVKEHFLIAKSTLYRWLHAAQEGNLGERKSKSESPRKTPAELARMIWDIFEANPYVGGHRIASILWLLVCLLRGDETGLDGSDGTKRGAGEDDIPGRIPAGAVQLCICGILGSAILAIAAVGAAPDELETLLRAVPSPRNKHTGTHVWVRTLPRQAMSLSTRSARSYSSHWASCSSSTIPFPATPAARGLPLRSCHTTLPTTPWRQLVSISRHRVSIWPDLARFERDLT